MTRRQILIGMLGDARGLSAREAAKVLGWRPASVRAELTRLRAQGLALEVIGHRPRRHRLRRQGPSSRRPSALLPAPPSQSWLNDLGVLP
jgi:predicted ArsR family transcriptional regulator